MFFLFFVLWHKHFFLVLVFLIMRLTTLAHNTTLMSKPLCGHPGVSIDYVMFHHVALHVIRIFFQLWNEEYRDGMKTSGDKIGMALWHYKYRQTTKHTYTYTHTQRQDTRCPALRTGAVG